MPYALHGRRRSVPPATHPNCSTHSPCAYTASLQPLATVNLAVLGRYRCPKILTMFGACVAEVLGSLKCDCAEQLELALQMIQNQPPGIVIYLQQEGRGIGLANKIAAYSLQARGWGRGRGMLVLADVRTRTGRLRTRRRS